MILDQGDTANPRNLSAGKRGRVKQSKVTNLLTRLREHADDVWRFMHDPTVPLRSHLPTTLLSTMGAAIATGQSVMLEGEVSHDQITRFLSEQDYRSKDLWQQVKPTVRKVEREDGVLILDDTIQEKTWTDESELMCWHYDHCRGRNIS